MGIIYDYITTRLAGLAFSLVYLCFICFASSYLYISTCSSPVYVEVDANDYRMKKVIDYHFYENIHCEVTESFSNALFTATSLVP